MIVAGIDGGGSKTEAVIASIDKKDNINILARFKTGGCNINSSGKDFALKSISDCAEFLTSYSKNNDLQIDYSFWGISGSMSNGNGELIKQFLIDKYNFLNFEVGSDVLNAGASAFVDNKGIIVISGTGVSGFLYDNFNIKNRVGGFGNVVDADGSGFQLGRDILNIALREEDGRISSDKIFNEFVSKYKVKPSVFANKNSAFSGDSIKNIASLSDFAVKMYLDNDEYAKKIIYVYIDSIVEIINSLKNMSRLTNVALTGGLISNNQLLFDLIKNKLPSDIELFVNSEQQVVGACKMAQYLACKRKEICYA